MQCIVYKSLKKYGCYLYVLDEETLSRLPEALLQLLGGLEKVMDLSLSSERKLAQADVMMVMQQLEERGFYLQMPPKDYQPDA